MTCMTDKLLDIARAPPIRASSFQINKRLYICGGVRLSRTKTEIYRSTFSSIEYSGTMTQLVSMNQGRGNVSLSGISSRLISLGDLIFGSPKVHNLKTCESYSVAYNKWTELPPLNGARHMPGSILLNSMVAFCFYRAVRFECALNSI